MILSNKNSKFVENVPDSSTWWAINQGNITLFPIYSDLDLNILSKSMHCLLLLEKNLLVYFYCDIYKFRLGFDLMGDLPWLIRILVFANRPFPNLFFVTVSCMKTKPYLVDCK